jgi:hypothetical protein
VYTRCSAPLNKPSHGNNQSDAGHNAQFHPVLLIKAASLKQNEILSTYNDITAHTDLKKSCRMGTAAAAAAAGRCHIAHSAKYGERHGITFPQAWYHTSTGRMFEACEQC